MEIRLFSASPSPSSLILMDTPVDSAPVDSPPVLFECISDEKGKLRVRPISPGYYPNANCQFPRDLREVGRRYSVHPRAVTLVTSRGKWYYSVRMRSAIQVLNLDLDAVPVSPTSISTLEAAVKVKNLTIYEDQTSPDCTICMESPKTTIIIPCGHFYTCATCTEKIQKCPICRCHITGRVNQSQMG